MESLVGFLGGVLVGSLVAFLVGFLGGILGGMPWCLFVDISSVCYGVVNRILEIGESRSGSSSGPHNRGGCPRHSDPTWLP